MTRPVAKALAAAMAAAALAGCQSPVSSGMRSTIAVEGDVAVSASLNTDNPGVARHIALVGVTTQLLPTGLLKVQARIASNDNRDYPVQYKFRWFDAYGMEILDNGSTPWLPLVIHGGEVATGEGVSPKPGIAAVTVQVRKM